MDRISRLAKVCALVLGVTLGLGAVLGVGVAWHLRSRPRLPDAAGLVERVREVARVETLEVEVRQLVSWAADPVPAETLPGQVASWLLHTVRPREGRAYVAGTARVGFDLGGLDARALRVQGTQVLVELPPLRTDVLLQADALQVIESNLDSEQTAQLLDLGMRTIRMNVERDAALQARARASAEGALRRLLTTIGFTEVRFVDAPETPGPAPAS